MFRACARGESATLTRLIFAVKIIRKKIMTKFNCSNIDWDIEDEDENPNLATEMTVEVDLSEVTPGYDEGDLVGDALTAKTGFCHNGFSYVQAD